MYLSLGEPCSASYGLVHDMDTNFETQNLVCSIGKCKPNTKKKKFTDCICALERS